MKSCLEKWKGQGRENYSAYVDYYRKYPLWGNLDPDKDDYETFALRAHMIKEHLEELIWLYNILADYRSKQSLLAVLFNWTDFNLGFLGDVRERSLQYYDLDLVPSGEEEVFVDVGAYVGDSVLDFIKSYGIQYRKIYAYEPDGNNAEKLAENTERYHDIVIRRKGAGKEQGEFSIIKGTDPSANHLGREEEERDSQERDMDRVEVVTLDEDIAEPVTWIKMDIEGAEYDALQGASEHIKKDRPKLSISVYHGYDDLWRLPKLIYEMVPSYRFYLRYYGGNLIPTEIVLTALPAEEQ